MVTSLFPPYPDEVALSWFIRYHVISGNRRWQDTSQELFGKIGHNPNILYALNLSFFCSQIPSELEINHKYIINKMTIFPLFKPFMPLERANKVIQSMVDDVSTVLVEMGAYTGEIFLKEGRIVKVCKVCLENDKKVYRESYLHTSHQVPGSFLCIKHNNPLSFFSVSNDKNNLLIDIDSLNDRELKSYQIKPNLVQYFISLGEDIEFVLNGGLSSFSVDTIIKQYRQRLKEKGYVLTKRINQSHLIADFKRFYPIDFLESLESNIEISNTNWLRMMFVARKSIIHPIRHLLLIRFLFGSTKEFLNYNSEYKPFGNSPYPCLNPAADHFKQEVIQNYKLKRINSISNTVGVFECDCGFEYSRRGPDKAEVDRFKYLKVLKYGHVWENKLKELLNTTSDISFIAREMKCDTRTVIKFIYSFGIVDILKTKQIITAKKIEKISDIKLGVYKDELIQYIIDNPDARKQQIKKSLSKQYELIHKKDRQWLKEILQQNFVALKKNHKDKEWKQKDEKTLQKIELVVREILLEEKPRRITRSYIAHKIRNYGIHNKEFVKKLPKT